MAQASVSSKKGFFYYVEKGGNALPHPALLFGIFALTVLALSLVGSLLGWHGAHPATGDQVEVVNLLSREGVHRILLEMVTNYTGFAPLGIVMVALLGIGVAETSGLIKAAINAMLVKAPAKAVTFMIIFAGLLSNVASDVGYVLIIPLAGVIFHSLGRHPIAGLAAAFAGVSAGFSANIIITPLDPMLAGLTQEAARIVDANYEVLPTANYFFLAGATILLSIVGTIVCTKWVEPSLGTYTGNVEREEIVQPTELERKGLSRVGWLLLGWLVVMVVGLFPETFRIPFTEITFGNPLGEGILRGDVVENGTVVGTNLMGTPLLRGIVTMLFLVGVSAGALYGFTVGRFKKAEDIILGMNENFKTLAVYLVLTFFAAQFVAWFRHSELGMILAINGAAVLEGIVGSPDAYGNRPNPIPLILIFTIFTAFLNIFIGSASAKWAILAPVYVPIFMVLGWSPEFAQAVYHAGDNATNIISPLLPYFALIIVFYQKYDKDAGIGTIIASVLPYSITFFIAWVGLLIAWVLIGIPLGPGTPLYYVIGG